MNSPLLHRLLLALCLALGPVLFAADPKPATPAAIDPVLALPKMEVTAQRIKKIDKELKRLDKLIEREEKKVKSTELDKALNNASLAHVAAIFGGNSADHLSAVAATRVSLLLQERGVLEGMKRPTTLDELDMMEKEIEQLRITRRNLDDPAKQR